MADLFEGVATEVLIRSLNRGSVAAARPGLSFSPPGLVCLVNCPAPVRTTTSGQVAPLRSPTRVYGPPSLAASTEAIQGHVRGVK
jgi:hypothetical protein